MDGIVVQARDVAVAAVLGVCLGFAAGVLVEDYQASALQRLLQEQREVTTTAWMRTSEAEKRGRAVCALLRAEYPAAFWQSACPEWEVAK